MPGIVQLIVTASHFYDCARLPPTYQHPMWQSWDMAAEQVLMQLPELLQPNHATLFKPTTFFAEQLDAFQLWLKQGSRHKPPPRQLPIVLQVWYSFC